jgi:hypothetical protein
MKRQSHNRRAEVGGFDRLICLASSAATRPAEQPIKIAGLSATVWSENKEISAADDCVLPRFARMLDAVTLRDGGVRGSRLFVRRESADFRRELSTLGKP